jgi:hypothetical protein
MRQTHSTLGTPKGRGHSVLIPSYRRGNAYAVMQGGCHVQFDQTNKQLIISRHTAANAIKGDRGPKALIFAIRRSQIVDRFSLYHGIGVGRRNA